MHNQEILTMKDRFLRRNTKKGKPLDISGPFCPAVEASQLARHAAGANVIRILDLMDLRISGQNPKHKTDELDDTRESVLKIFYSCMKMTSSKKEALKLTKMLNKAFITSIPTKAFSDITQSIDNHREKHRGDEPLLIVHRSGSIYYGKNTIVKMLHITKEEQSLIGWNRYEDEARERERRQDDRLSANVQIARMYLDGVKVSNIISETGIPKATVYRHINEMDLKRIKATGGTITDVDFINSKPWARTA